MNNKMTGRFIVWGKRDSSLPSTICVSAKANLSAQIQIRPHNKMSGKFDIIERPVDVYAFAPIKDSTIRSMIPTLNYGFDPAMLVGVDENSKEKFRGAIKFDLSSLPANREFKKATLKLYKTFSAHPVTISLFAIEQDWIEKDITWSNQPRSGIKIAEYTIEKNKQNEVLVDISSVLIKWYNHELPNYGLYIMASNETDSSVVQFGTKESLTPPMLEVSFYKIITSAGISRMPSVLSVRAKDKQYLHSSLEVFSKFKQSEMPALLVIEEKEEDSTCHASISIRAKGTPEQINGTLIIQKKDGQSEIPSIIKVPTNDPLSASLTIERKDSESKLPSQIKIKYNEYLLSRFTITKKERDANLPVQIKITATEDLYSHLTILKKSDYKELLAKIRIKEKADLSAKVILEKKAKSKDLNASIQVKEAAFIPSRVIVPWRNNLRSKLYVQHKRDLPAKIQVTSYFLNAQIKIRGFEKSDVQARLTVRVKNISDLSSRLMVVSASEEADFAYVFIL